MAKVLYVVVGFKYNQLHSAYYNTCDYTQVAKCVEEAFKNEKCVEVIIRKVVLP